MNKKVTVKEELDAGRIVATFTTGASMEPLLYHQKTFVLIKPIEGELSTGELPIYQKPDGVYVIHRVVKVDSDYYYTRGDNCFSCEKIPKDWVIGVVIEIYRHGKIIKVENLWYQVYVKVWMWIYPVRKRYHMVKTRIRSIKNMISKKRYSRKENGIQE